MADKQEPTAEHTGGEADESQEEATKRKFREALERKNGHASMAGAAQSSAKVHGTHAQAGGKRTFRRRAGG
ncbi:DUF5302 domain-containing protein [Nocardia sp. NPDC057663]|uniref:DUF5302 domain-containing protein n=1 Tax=Nocardia sp. NPDC057663 TaxID=3346201 RepID=UPI00366DCEC7